MDGFFRDLPPEKLTSLNTSKATHHYQRGEGIFLEGNVPSGVYCIQKGKVKLVKNGADGNEVIIRILQAGDVLGYRSLLSGETYAATAKALEETEVCFIDRHVFTALVKDDPDLAFKVIRRMGQELAAAQDRVHDLVSKSVRERLSELLLALAKSHGKPSEEGIFLDIRLSRADFAALIGSSTETVIRLLSDFQDTGILLLQGKKIIIADKESLVREAALDI